MRFSIRDLLWVTLVVAMGLCWWGTNSKRLEAVRQAHGLHDALSCAKANEVLLMGANAKLWISLNKRIAAETGTDGYFNHSHDEVHVDWGILDKPLVEP